MWEKEREAFASGKRIQVLLPHSGRWTAATSPTWSASSYRIHPDDVEKESNTMQEFKVGDRVEYVYVDGFAVRKGGETGTIVPCPEGQSSQNTYVQWDRDSTVLPHGKPYLKLLVNKDEVEKALRTLKAAGKVTFVPNKLPFQQRSIRLNSSYTANVSEKDVTVGCQTFHFAVVEELYAAVQKAREYNKEGV